MITGTHVIVSILRVVLFQCFNISVSQSDVKNRCSGCKREHLTHKRRCPGAVFNWKSLQIFPIPNRFACLTRIFIPAFLIMRRKISSTGLCLSRHSPQVFICMGTDAGPQKMLWCIQWKVSDVYSGACFIPAAFSCGTDACWSEILVCVIWDEMGNIIQQMCFQL